MLFWKHCLCTKHQIQFLVQYPRDMEFHDSRHNALHENIEATAQHNVNILHTNSNIKSPTKKKAAIQQVPATCENLENLPEQKPKKEKW